MLIFFGFEIKNLISTVSNNLLIDFPAVATIYFTDDRSDNDENSFNPLTMDSIRKISDLNGVESYDINILGEVATRNLTHVFEPTLTEIHEKNINRNRLRDQVFISNEEFVSFSLHGVQNIDLIDVQTGLIEIIEGTGFTNDQIESAAPYVVISSLFALANDLNLYSTFRLESAVFDWRELGGNWWRGERNETYLNWIYEIELKVIGIFEIITEFDYVNDEIGAMIRDFELQNRIMMPNALVEQINQSTHDARAKVEPYFNYHPITIPRTIFVLKDHGYSREFIESSNYILDYPFQMIDLSVSVEHLLTTHKNINSLISGFVFFEVVALLLISILMMISFVIERRMEIAVYLSLGEKRKNVLSQIVCEKTIIIGFSFVTSIILSLFLREIINQNLNEFILNNVQPTEATMVGERIRANIPTALTFFIGGSQSQLPIYSLLHATRLELSFSSYIKTFGFAIATILFSFLIPRFYIGVSHKKLLE